MERWILPIIAIAVLSLVLPALSRLITQRTGRSKSVKGVWLLVIPIGIFLSVIAVSYFNLDLPWLAVAAGVSADLRRGGVARPVGTVAGRVLVELCRRCRAVC